jgi:hypothetical protein
MNMFLRPLAISLLRFAIPFYRKFLQVAPELRESGAGGVAGGVITGAVGGAAVGAGIGALGGGVGAAPVALGGAILGGIAAIGLEWDKILPNMIQGIKNLGEIIGTWIDDFLKGIGIDGSQMISDVLDKWAEFSFFMTDELPNAVSNFAVDVRQFFEETLPEAFTKAWNKIKDFLALTLPEKVQFAWDSIANFLTVTIPNKVTETWEKIKTFFSDTVPGWIKMGFDAVKTFFTVDVPDWIGSMIDTVKSKIKDIPGVGAISSAAAAVITGAKSFISRDDFMMMPGGQVVQTDPTDVIMGVKKSKLGQGGNAGPTNITININALDASSIDRALISKITSEIEQKLKRGFGAKTTEFIGI